MRAAGRRIDDEVLTHVSLAPSDNINFFGAVDADVDVELGPARAHRLPTATGSRHAFLTRRRDVPVEDRLVRSQIAEV